MFKLLYILFFFIRTENNSYIDTSTYTIIKNVNIVDVVKGKIRFGKTVIIKDSMIAGIINSNVKFNSSSATIIDGKDKFLIPGLWDMHFHLAWDESNHTLLFPILFKYGITGIRDMGGQLNILSKFKKEIISKTIDGPDIYGAGPILDGNPPVHKDFSMPVDSSTNLKYQLDSLRKGGADFLKVYSLIKESELKAIQAWSKYNNITFAGHLSEYINPEISIKLGQKSVEHFNRLEDIWFADKKRIELLSKLMRKNKTWLCPTMITYFLKVHMIDSSINNDKLENYINTELKKEWIAARQSRINKLNDKVQLAKQEKLYEQGEELLRFFYQKKIKLLAGSDFAGMPYVYPGIGLHQELELMVKAGLPIAEVLKSATINPALYFGIEKKNGTVAKGKYATMILLGKNPLLNISNTQSIVTVFKKGKIVN